MKRKILALLTMFIVGLLAVSAQQSLTVNGIILSADDNEPIIGASVLVVGTNRGTITDIDGKFSIPNVTSGSELKISYVGMASQVVKAAANLRISLKSDTKVLDEVVVTRFGYPTPGQSHRLFYG